MQLKDKNFIKATEECCSFDKHVNAPYIRKRFELDFLPQRAEIAICGVGFYRLFVNGKELTKGLLAPYISNPDDYCYYDSYDIMEHLVQGENVIGILLGNGFMNPFGGVVWDFDKADWKGAPVVDLELEIEGEERMITIRSDESFRVNPSPITFDEMRMGEWYDARLEQDGWNAPGFDDRDWKYAIRADKLRGEWKQCEAEPIRIQKRLKPVSITKCEAGYLYDFGENSAGLTELTVSAQPGQIISLWHGELLVDGRFDNSDIIFPAEQFGFYKEYNQRTVYIAKGGEKEVYMPSFTYYGFRYVLVQGITEEQATPELLTYLVMNSDLKHIGGFHCSDETVNTLFEMVKRTDLANFYYFPTDCPHREKNGWTGDASLSSDHMALLYDTESSWREWLCNIRKAQRSNGAIPGIIPTFQWGIHNINDFAGPGWDSALFNLPYMIYKYRGKTEAIKENAHAMVRYLEYAWTRRDENGLVAFGLGDYIPVGKSSRDYDAPLILTESIMLMDIARKAAEMFSVIGHDLFAQLAEYYYETMRSAIREHLLHKESMEMEGRCQSSQALALYYGVFEEHEKEKAFEKLMMYIHQKGDNFDCGCLGLHVLFHVLSDFGQGALAYHMITKKEYPSYGHLLECGETTFTETFLKKGERRRASHNHHFMVDISRWFMERVAGLHIVDSTHLEICPDYIEGMSYAEAYYELPEGKIAVRWDKIGENIYELSVSCPEGVQCCLKLPEGSVTKVL